MGGIIFKNGLLNPYPFSTMHGFHPFDSCTTIGNRIHLYAVMQGGIRIFGFIVGVDRKQAGFWEMALSLITILLKDIVG